MAQAARHRIELSDQRSAARRDYGTIVAIAVRWSDFDPLGHVNNVEYYRYFEIAVMRLLADAGLDWSNDDVIPVAVESLCRYRRSIGLTAEIEAGICVGAMGRSSATYEIAIFSSGNDTPAAYGHFIQVFTDRSTGASTTIPDHIRHHFESQLRKANE